MTRLLNFLSTISLVVAVLMIPFAPILLMFHVAETFNGRGGEFSSLLIFLVSYLFILLGYLNIGVQQRNNLFTFMSFLNIWVVIGLIFRGETDLNLSENLRLTFLVVTVFAPILLGLSALDLRSRFGWTVWPFSIVQVAIGVSVSLGALPLLPLYASFILGAALLAKNKKTTSNVPTQTSL